MINVTRLSNLWYNPIMTQINPESTEQELNRLRILSVLQKQLIRDLNEHLGCMPYSIDDVITNYSQQLYQLRHFNQPGATRQNVPPFE